jgi:hypothetical protein
MPTMAGGKNFKAGCLFSLLSFLIIYFTLFYFPHNMTTIRKFPQIFLFHMVQSVKFLVHFTGKIFQVPAHFLISKAPSVSRFFLL